VRPRFRRDGKIRALSAALTGRGLNRRALASLASSADVVRLDAGSFAEVGRHHHHVVLEGTVVVADGAVTLGPGETIPAAATLVALTDVVLLVVDARAFHDATL
jgi:CRP-like cAMP-binding protein